jgi:hypothetical protein
MTGLFTRDIGSSGMIGKSNPTKNQNRPKDLSSFDNNLEICSGNLNFELKTFFKLFN